MSTLTGDDRIRGPNSVSYFAWAMTARFTDCSLGNRSAELPDADNDIGDESHFEERKSKEGDVAVSRVTSEGFRVESAFIFKISPWLLGDH